MGCCQSAIVTNNEEILLGNEHQHKAESACDSILTVAFQDCQNLRSDAPTRLYASEELSLLYTISSRICTVPYGERLACFHNPSDSKREIIVLHKAKMSVSLIEKVLEIGNQLQKCSASGLLKVFYVGEDDRNINIVTQHCGKKTLEEVIASERIPPERAVEYLDQILEGVMEYHKLGVILHCLACTDLFEIENSIKISPLVLLNSVPSTPDVEIDQKSDIWSIGVIFLKMLKGSTSTSRPNDLLSSIDSIFSSPEDLLMLQKLFKPQSSRCSLSELLNHDWSFPVLKLSKLISSSEFSEDCSEDAGSERIANSDDESNEFNQNRNRYLNEENDCDWQVIEINSPVRKMAEIVEFSPDHEVSSVAKNLEIDVRISDENPLDRGTSENFFLFSNFSLAESPIANDSARKTPKNADFCSPEFNKDHEGLSNDISLENILESKSIIPSCPINESNSDSCRNELSISI